MSYPYRGGPPAAGDPRNQQHQQFAAVANGGLRDQRYRLNGDTTDNAGNASISAPQAYRGGPPPSSHATNHNQQFVPGQNGDPILVNNNASSSGPQGQVYGAQPPRQSLVGHHVGLRQRTSTVAYGGPMQPLPRPPQDERQPFPIAPLQPQYAPRQESTQTHYVDERPPRSDRHSLIQPRQYDSQQYAVPPTPTQQQYDPMPPNGPDPPLQNHHLQQQAQRSSAPIPQQKTEWHPVVGPDGRYYMAKIPYQQPSQQARAPPPAEPTRRIVRRVPDNRDISHHGESNGPDRYYLQPDERGEPYDMQPPAAHKFPRSVRQEEVSQRHYHDPASYNTHEDDDPYNRDFSLEQTTTTGRFNQYGSQQQASRNFGGGLHSTNLHHGRGHGNAGQYPGGTEDKMRRTYAAESVSARDSRDYYYDQQKQQPPFLQENPVQNNDAAAVQQQQCHPHQQQQQQQQYRRHQQQQQQQQPLSLQENPVHNNDAAAVQQQQYHPHQQQPRILQEGRLGHHQNPTNYHQATRHDNSPAVPQGQMVRASNEDGAPTMGAGNNDENMPPVPRQQPGLRDAALVSGQPDPRTMSHNPVATQGEQAQFRVHHVATGLFEKLRADRSSAELLRSFESIELDDLDELDQNVLAGNGVSQSQGNQLESGLSKPPPNNPPLHNPPLNAGALGQNMSAANDISQSQGNQLEILPPNAPQQPAPVQVQLSATNGPTRYHAPKYPTSVSNPLPAGELHAPDPQLGTNGPAPGLRKRSIVFEEDDEKYFFHPEKGVKNIFGWAMGDDSTSSQRLHKFFKIIVHSWFYDTNRTVEDLLKSKRKLLKNGDDVFGSLSTRCQELCGRANADLSSLHVIFKKRLEMNVGPYPLRQLASFVTMLFCFASESREAEGVQMLVLFLSETVLRILPRNKGKFQQVLDALKSNKFISGDLPKPVKNDDGFVFDALDCIYAHLFRHATESDYKYATDAAKRIKDRFAYETQFEKGSFRQWFKANFCYAEWTPSDPPREALDPTKRPDIFCFEQNTFRIARDSKLLTGDSKFEILDLVEGYWADGQVMLGRLKGDDKARFVLKLKSVPNDYDPVETSPWATIAPTTNSEYLAKVFGHFTILKSKTTDKIAFVLGYCGSNLRTLIGYHKFQRMPLPDKARNMCHIIMHILLGVEDLSSKGHECRDLQPENVWFDEHRVTITDFKISRGCHESEDTYYANKPRGRQRFSTCLEKSIGIIAYEIMSGKEPAYHTLNSSRFRDGDARAEVADEIRNEFGFCDSGFAAGNRFARQGEMLVAFVMGLLSAHSNTHTALTEVKDLKEALLCEK